MYVCVYTRRCVCVCANRHEHKENSSKIFCWKLIAQSYFRGFLFFLAIELTHWVVSPGFCWEKYIRMECAPAGGSPAAGGGGHTGIAVVRQDAPVLHLGGEALEEQPPLGVAGLRHRVRCQGVASGHSAGRVRKSDRRISNRELGISSN